MTIQQTHTKWSIPETTTGCVIGPDEEKKENIKTETIKSADEQDE